MAAFGRTLIVVLDDSRARFLKRENSGTIAESLPELNGGPEDQSAGAEKRRQLLRAVMSALDRACDRNECDRLMVVGPERLLGAFRKAASDKVRVRLWRETAMEVSHIGEAELERRLAPHFR